MNTLTNSTKFMSLITLVGGVMLFSSFISAANANDGKQSLHSQLYVFATDIRTPYAYEIVNQLTLMLITEDLAIGKNFKVVEKATRGSQMSLELRTDERILGAVPLNIVRQHTREKPRSIAEKLLSAAIQSGFLIPALSQ